MTHRVYKAKKRPVKVMRLRMLKYMMKTGRTNRTFRLVSEMLSSAVVIVKTVIHEHHNYIWIAALTVRAIEHATKDNNGDH